MLKRLLITMALYAVLGLLLGLGGIKVTETPLLYIAILLNVVLIDINSWVVLSDESEDS